MYESNKNDCDLDFDLHAIWQDSSGIPMPPPCLATDPGKARQISSDEGEPAGYGIQGSSVIECFVHPTYDKLPAFKWMGPDPLSMSTQASDMFFYMSAFAFPIEVHWIEFRLVRFDRKTGERIGERLFILPRIETALGNLCREHGNFVFVNITQVEQVSLHRPRLQRYLQMFHSESLLCDETCGSVYILLMGSKTSRAENDAFTEQNSSHSAWAWQAFSTKVQIVMDTLDYRNLRNCAIGAIIGMLGFSYFVIDLLMFLVFHFPSTQESIPYALAVIAFGGGIAVWYLCVVFQNVFNAFHKEEATNGQASM
ncbi:hypothetical protein MYU51_020329 [Penicillium brevicompactum]